jgi:hypothetical protein
MVKTTPIIDAIANAESTAEKLHLLNRMFDGVKEVVERGEVSEAFNAVLQACCDAGIAATEAGDDVLAAGADAPTVESYEAALETLEPAIDAFEKAIGVFVATGTAIDEGHGALAESYVEQKFRLRLERLQRIRDQVEAMLTRSDDRLPLPLLARPRH